MCQSLRGGGIGAQIEQVCQANLQVHCTVERLMRGLGLQGVMRGKFVRTTISGRSAPCPLDKVHRSSLPSASESALGVGLHPGLDLAGLVVRRLHHRRVRPTH